MKEKFLSILLTLCMALSLLPATAWADDTVGSTSGTHPNHCVCGATHAEDGNGHANITNWKSIGTADALMSISQGGNYYLEKDIELSDTWKPAEGWADVVLCLNGHSITGLSDNNVISIVSAESEITFTLTDCKTTGTITHASGVNGRGVKVGRSCTFDMYGGSITGNNADNNGGGVYTEGAFNMYGGSITQNTKNYNGGGVYVDSSGTFTMKGGKISGNTVDKGYGGGVCVNGTFTMSGGEISENNATGYGGGVYVSGTFNMTGGEISDNTANEGGGVRVNGTFTMTGGEITSNKATGTNYNVKGGGVYVYGTFTMNGGSITNNNATGTNSDGGGGVYVDGNMTVSGNVQIKYNVKGGTFDTNSGKYTGSTANNVCLSNNVKFFTINGALTGGAGSIGVTTGDTPDENGVRIAKVASSYKVIDKDRQAFVSDVDSTKYKVTYNKTDNGEKAFYLTTSTEVNTVPEHEHPICGASCSHDGDDKHNDVEWIATDSLPESAGHYYLTEDLRLGNTWEPVSGVVLCLNGHSIKANGNFSAIAVYSNKEFTLTDCKTGDQEGTITHESGKTGSGVSVDGTFDMYGGSITGNKAENGGGVYIYSNTSGAKGTFNMYGGKIIGNEAEGDNGGGVSVDDGTFNMKNGSITDNTAKGNGGGVSVNSDYYSKTKGTFNMNGGKITGNEAGYGGGVYMDGDTFTMNGGEISNNTTTQNYGGGVYAYAGTITMKGGSITGNTAAYGGGVYVESGRFTMSGGSITGNTADYGGGVNALKPFTMTGGNITGNTADNGGGVYETGTFTMSGGEITGNNVSNDTNHDGGGVNVSGKMIVSGNAKIYDNVKGGEKNTETGLYVKGENGADNNVYLSSDSSTITIGGELTNGASIGVTTRKAPSKGEPVTFATGASTDKNEDYYKGIFTSDNSQYEVKKDTDNNTLYLAVKSGGTSGGEDTPSTDEHKHFLCGGDTCTEVGHDKETSATTFATALKMDSDGKLYKGNSEWQKNSYGVYKLSDGNYYLDSDITVDKSISIEGDVILCLNGKTITANAVDAIKVDNGKSLTLTDCKGGGNDYGKITHAENTTGRGVHVYKGTTEGTTKDTTFTMYGGSITGNSATGNGGGVFVESNSTFTMYGGKITGNEVTSSSSVCNGGGVYVQENGTFNMNGGEISQNKARNDDKALPYGGGVYVDGTFTMNGGSITKNHATGSPSYETYGGGVCVNDTFTMTGGTITDNTADKYGGVLVRNDGKFTMTGGAITNNTADNFGGVGMLGGITVSGNAKITGNKKVRGATETDSNVYLGSDKTITINGALTNGVSIGVTTANKPEDGKDVQIAKGTSGDSGYSVTSGDKDIFTSDAGYTVTLKGNALYLTTGSETPTTHTHNWSTVWTNNETHHWHECTADGCTLTDNSEKDGYAEHVYDDDTDITCNTCDYTRTVTPSTKYTVTAYNLYGETTGITPGATYRKQYAVGAQVDLQIGKRDGYTLESLTLNGIRENELTWNAKDQESIQRGIFFAMPANDVTVTVNWKANSSSSGGSSGGGGGSSKYAVTASSADNGNVTLDKTSAKKGSTVTITPQANDGFALDKITVTDKNGSEIKLTDNGNGTFTFTMPASKVTINTTFKEIEKTPETEPPKEEVKQTVVKMQINSKRLIVNDTAYEKDAAPVIRNDRTLVPIRFITESLGGKVTWNEKAKEVVLTIDGKEIKMTIGKTLEKYGVAPIIMDDRTFVPIRFVADELGATVAWDEPTKTVTVTKTVTEQK